MNRRWIYKISFFVTALTMAATSVNANQVTAQSAEDRELEERVFEAQSYWVPAANLQSKPQLNLKNLRDFWSLQEKAQKSCQDARKVLFADKFVLTYDRQNQPCRIYDLSFPNLKALMSQKSLLQVPVRKLTSRDFLDALDQNWGAIQQRNQEFAKNFNPKNVAVNSFVTQLKFKKTPNFINGSQVQGRGLPSSFSLGDVQLQAPFKLNEAIQNDFKRLMLKLETQGSTNLYRELAENPESMLKAVRFEWNDLDKVYNVILDGRFLPFLGPVEVMNFQEQYRASVEKLTRQILGDLLSQIVRFIPEPVTAAVVEVIIDDVFEQIEMMYRYQALRLEQALTTLDASKMRTEDFQVLSTRGLALLYGQQSDLVSAFIMSAIQGQEFDWQGMEKLGASTGYTIQKQRKVTMSQMHSRLVLETGCQTEIISNYFAVCTLKGKKHGIYSLLSEKSIPFKSFGAPQIYNYQRPYAVSATRGSLWVLSAGLRIVGIPISRQATYFLDGYIKNFMQTGILDEAFLQSDLMKKSADNRLAGDERQVMDWLYIQNLNPFLPKSHKGEMSLIQSNKGLLGQVEE